MSSKEKKIKRFKSIPSNYTEKEFISLLKSLEFSETKRKNGKVKYENGGNKLIYHPPHDTGTFKNHYLKEWKKDLEKWEYI